jgi:hypothetical protein
MDDDLETGFYVAAGTAAAAGGVATGGIIYYGPSVALPTFAGWLGIGATSAAATAAISGPTAGTAGIASEAVASSAFGGPAAFGRLIGWGKGAADAALRTGTISAGELQAAGMTLPILRYWREFYSAALVGGRGAETAVERLKLMQRSIELLGGN